MPPDPLEGLCFALHPEKIPLIYDQPKFQMTKSNLFLVGHFVRAKFYPYIVLWPRFLYICFTALYLLAS